MTELFTERWSLLLAAGEQVKEGPGTPREKLSAIAGFIIESGSPRPRPDEGDHHRGHAAANSFGRTHLPEIRQAYDQVAQIVAAAQTDGAFRTEIDADFVGMAYYGAIEQVLSGWVFGCSRLLTRSSPPRRR